MSYLKRHPFIIAYAVLVIMNCVGWYLLQDNAQADAERAHDTAVAVCQASYDTRVAVDKFIEAQTSPLPVPAGPPEAVESALRSNERRAQVRKESGKAFGPPDCIHTLGLKVDVGGRLVPL